MTERKCIHEVYQHRRQSIPTAKYSQSQLFSFLEGHERLDSGGRSWDGTNQSNYWLEASHKQQENFREESITAPRPGDYQSSLIIDQVKILHLVLINVQRSIDCRSISCCSIVCFCLKDSMLWSFWSENSTIPGRWLNHAGF